jgi:hypothetical protein
MQNPTDIPKSKEEEKEPNWFQEMAISISDLSFGDIIFGIIMIIVFIILLAIGVVLLVNSFINYPGITSLIFFPCVIVFSTVIGIWLYGKYLES